MDDGAAEAIEDDPALEPFRPLGEYDWPSTTIDRGLKRFVETLRKRFSSDDTEKEGIDLGQLAAAERAMLDDIVAPPANEPLLAELDATLEGWRSRARDDAGEPLANLRTIVLPPCDDEGFLRSWAGGHGLHVLEPPARDAFDRPAELPPGPAGGAEAFVVPRLEEWFLRDDTTLVAVRALLRHIDRSPDDWIVGCNSWAWQFLLKACSADAVLPAPLVPAAFDAERLRHWLGQLAGRPGSRALRFRSARSGRDAFAEEVEEDDGERNTMGELAERSLGIPWVAWNQWRASLRTSNGTDEPDAPEGADGTAGDGVDGGGTTSDERETLWVAELRDFSLPDRDDQQALLVLHALLVHGRLTEEEIHRTVPLARRTAATSALVNAGLVRREEGWHSCVPAAYPAIRDGLTVAGYPMDVL